MRQLEITEVATDPGVSGGAVLAARPGGKIVQAAVARGSVGAVIGWKLDRLFRDAIDCLTATRDWDERGVALHLTDLGGQAIDTSGAMGRFFMTVMAGCAELERNQIRDRTYAALQLKQARGEWIGGNISYGLKLEAGKLVPDERERQVINFVRRLRNQGATLQQIGAELTRRGVLTRHGKRDWHPMQIARILERERKNDE